MNPPSRSAGGARPGRLPRGRHRLPPEAVAENQRQRLILATGRALAEQGYAALTVKHITETASVSRTTFYANFDGKRDCVLGAHRDAGERLVLAVARACEGEEEWPQRVSAAISAAVGFLAAEPGAACLLELNAATTDLAIASQLVDYKARLVDLLREGRDQASCGPGMPPLTEAALIGALAYLATEVFPTDKRPRAVLELEVTQLVLTPYVGSEEAARVAAAAPRAASKGPRRSRTGAG